MTRRAAQRLLIAAVGILSMVTGFLAGANVLSAIFGCVGVLILIGLFMTGKVRPDEGIGDYCRRSHSEN